MTQRRATRRVIVSLHDVAPPFEAAIQTQLEMLADVGVRRVALMVVPNWHGAAPLHSSPSFVSLLQAQVAAGSQLVLHGFEHRPAANRPFAGPWLSRVRARLFAADAAECLTLSADEMADALRRGVACFAQAGLPQPTTFCAPGWLYNAQTLAALRQTGFRSLIGMFTVRDAQDRRRAWTPAVGYMGAGPGQELGVQILNGIVQRTALRTASVASVYLHPQRDLAGAIVRQQLARLAAMIERDGWQPATYAEVCGDGDQ
jgi:predicted deacetylase